MVPPGGCQDPPAHCHTNVFEHGGGNELFSHIIRVRIVVHHQFLATLPSIHQLSQGQGSRVKGINERRTHAIAQAWQSQTPADARSQSFLTACPDSQHPASHCCNSPTASPAIATITPSASLIPGFRDSMECRVRGLCRVQSVNTGVPASRHRYDGYMREERLDRAGGRKGKGWEGGDPTEEEERDSLERHCCHAGAAHVPPYSHSISGQWKTTT